VPVRRGQLVGTWRRSALRKRSSKLRQGCAGDAEIAVTDRGLDREAPGAVSMSTEISHYIEAEIAKWGGVSRKASIRAQISAAS